MLNELNLIVSASLSLPAVLLGTENYRRAGGHGGIPSARHWASTNPA
ncbi:MAG: hypothetical protein HC942_16975 [Microcoleus sp. SU_5_6]|nr:hypothetical protein [Microcoleus sp. SU_5_6]